VPRLERRVTEVANDVRISEACERLRQLTFAQEELFAFVAPCLEIVRIAAVFYKADYPVAGLQDMYTYRGGYTLTMVGAIQDSHVLKDAGRSRR
jgi:hypothetical protein